METVEDIVRLIRAENPKQCYPAEYGGGEVPNMMRDLADRIEEATEALRADNAKLKKERTYLRALLHSAECENSFLSERYERCAKALEPVLAVMPSAWAVTNRFSLGEFQTPVYDGKWCEAAIIDAQRIYKEGVK